jgi:hypothetical protein
MRWPGPDSITLTVAYIVAFANALGVSSSIGVHPLRRPYCYGFKAFQGFGGACIGGDDGPARTIGRYRQARAGSLRGSPEFHIGRGGAPVPIGSQLEGGEPGTDECRRIARQATSKE